MRTDPAITRHLRGVVASLSNAPATPARAAVLARLGAYADAGAFPRPDAVRLRPRAVVPPRAFAGPGDRMPLFRDAAGTFCAVGHLYAADEPAAAAALADRVRDAYLPEVEDAGLRAWAARVGLTADELAFIQPTYCWEPPVCDDVEINTPAMPSEAECAGAVLTVTEPVYCQECDGPFRVWVWVQNPGDADLEGVSVALWAPAGGTVTTQDVGVVAAGNRKLVEITTSTVEGVGAGGGVRVTASNACNEPWEVEVWSFGNGGPGYVTPAECGTDHCADTASAGGSGKGSCAAAGSVGGGAAWLAALALVARRRRTA